MRNVKLAFFAVLVVLALVLTGCYKMVDISTVTYDGKLSGTIKFTFPIENAELNDSAQFIFNSHTVDGPIDGIVISYDDVENSFASISTCRVTGMKLEIPNDSYPYFSNFVIVSQPEGLDTLLYATGSIFSGADTQDGTMYVVDAQIISESGNVDDCAAFEGVTTGEVYVSTDYPSTTLNLGSLQMPEAAHLDSGLATLQLAHLPTEDRMAYQTILAMFAYSADSEKNRVEDWKPEFRQCWKYLKSNKFNALNNRAFVSGELARMINDSKRMHVTSNSKVLKITCKYSGVDLQYADRGINEQPFASESPRPMGFWVKADDNLTWEFRFRDFYRLDLEAVRSNGFYTINELNKTNNLDTHDSNMYSYLKNLGSSQTMTIEGVVLDTNADFNQTNNTVTFNSSGVAYSGRDLWLIEDSAKSGADYLHGLIGQDVSFKNGQKKLLTGAKELKAISKILKKSAPAQIRLVGIYDGSITSEKLAAKNVALVKKRLVVLKRKLKKLGVSATFVKGYVVDAIPNLGDSKAKNKVVAQIIKND